jgi:outer membrane protein assembly factor BamA
MLRTAVGATTVDYLQLQAQFTRYNWLGNGRRLDVTGSLGRLLAGPLDGTFPFAEVRRTDLPGASDDAFLRPTWQASAQVVQPAFPAPLSSVGFGVFTHRRVEPGVVVDRGYGATATFTRDLGRRAPLSLVYNYELNTVLAGDVYFCVSYGVCDRPTIAALQEQQSLSPLAISGFVDQVDDALVRGSGYTLRLSLEHASAVTLSDFHYNRANAEFARDFSIAGGTFAARIGGGWVRAAGGQEIGGGVMDSDDSGKLHPTKRFYAGGARSVRGFGENQLGPRILTVGPDKLLEANDSDTSPACVVAEIAAGTCDPNSLSSNEFTPRPIGGTRLIEAGIEYRRPLWGPFLGAVFIDAARVNDPALGGLAEARSAVTPGFGLRYRSPIGPVRVDLGFHPATTEELTVITELEEGGVGRLIRLETPKRYDPLEGRGGFLSELTNRLTLHLSIGESF